MLNRIIIYALVITGLHSFAQNDTNKYNYFYKKGNEYYNISQFDSALIFYKTALQNCDQSNNKDEYANIISSIGNVYEDLSKYQKALEYYQNALNLYKESNSDESTVTNKIGMSNALNQIGNVYYRWSDYENALKFYEEGLKIKEEINDLEGLPSSYNNIGNIYFSWSKYNKALEYYLKALKIKEKQSEKVELANYMINIGSAYLSLENFDNAQQYYKKALELSKEQNNKHMETSCLINIGVLYFEKGDYLKALTYYDQAYSMVLKLGSKLEQAYILRNMGETYIALKDFLKAKENISQSIVIAEKENLNSLISELYYYQYVIENNNNNYQDALEYYIKYSKLNDSIYNEESSKKLNDLLSKYEYEKKDMEIKQKNIEITAKQRKIIQQRLFFISSILLIILISLFIYYLYRNKETRRRTILESELNKQMQKSLSAQMNPHFISNALNSIQKYFLKNDIEKANEYLADFGSLIRSILENSRKFKIPLSDELQSIQLYINLEQMRLENKFTYLIEIDDSIDINNTLIPSMIIQPYIENAIWHGIAPLNHGGGLITINFKKQTNNLICEILDNGIGLKQSNEMKSQYRKKHKSLGMSINKERLDLLNKSGKINFSVDVVDLSDLNKELSGTKVELFINIIEDGKN
ncbi:MAG: DUF2225 domain-containing protein [Bacteroidota bacterium]